MSTSIGSNNSASHIVGGPGPLKGKPLEPYSASAIRGSPKRVLHKANEPLKKNNFQVDFYDR